MSELFEINLNYLKQYREELYEQVKSQLDKPSPITVILDENGSPNIEIEENGAVSYMYSTYNPEQDCKKWAEAIASDPSSKADVIMYGMGLTHHLAAYLTRFPDHQIFLYEPNIEIFIESLKIVSLADLIAHNNIRYLAVGEEESELGALFYNYYTYAFSMQGIIAIPYYVEACSRQFQEFQEILGKYVTNFVSREEFSKHTGIYQKENIIKNLPKVLSSPSLRCLKGAWQDKSVIVVGGGPSLDYDLALLKELQDRYIIVAAGTSIQALLKNDIKPHLVVSMDPYIVNYNVFSNLDLSDIPLLFIPTVEHRILEKDNLISIHAFFDHIGEYKYLLDLDESEDPVFIGSHSVTGTAVQAAIYLGVKEVIFIGQDLSFPGNIAYASDNRHLTIEQEQRLVSNLNERVENVNGGVNETSLKMKITLMDIEDLIKGYDNVQFINCSKGGAKIKGTEYRQLSQLTPPQDLYSRTDFIKEFEQLKKRYDDNMIYSVQQRLLEQKMWLSDIKSKINKLQKNLNNIEELSRTNPSRCTTLLAEIEETWGEIITHRNFIELFEDMLVVQFRKLDRMIPHIQKQSDLKLKTKMLRDALLQAILYVKYVAKIIELPLLSSIDEVMNISSLKKGETCE